MFEAGLFTDRVAVVTGGGTGIGLAIARRLGGLGARIAIASRNHEHLERGCASLRESGIDALAVQLDVRNPEQVDEMVVRTVKHFGGLDILVNNAAGNFPAPISGISYNGFRAVVGIDLLGTYNVSKAAFEAWMKDHGGNVVNISAPFERMGVAFQAHVAAAKTGVDSLTRTCAVEWGPLGIRVNGVAPGEIGGTEGVARFEAAVAPARANNPLGVQGARQDIANAVLFLVSDAARFVTGQILCVDGAASVDMLKARVME